MNLSMNRWKSKKIFIRNIILLTLCFVPSISFAIGIPVSTDFAYDLYDVGVNKVLKGPIGFVGGVACLVASAATITKNWILSVIGVLGGTAIIKADTLVKSMGMLINSI
jgi:hypothetical protein